MRRNCSLFSRNLGEFYTSVNNCVVKPTVLGHIQTDGSYRHMDKISRTALILKFKGEQFQNVKTYFNLHNSEEVEWLSVLNGILYAKTHKVTALQLENDNLSVMNSIIHERSPKDKFRPYYSTIQKNIYDFDWLDMRWIPRRYNRADDLFRLK